MPDIYTRRGDGGTTGLHGGGRVPKDDVRIEAVGALDELNCALGTVRALLPRGEGGDGGTVEERCTAAGERNAPRHDERDALLHRLQSEMMVVMSLAATPAERRAQNPNALAPDLTEWCEGLIDSLMARCADRGHFVLPGGTPLAAAMHTARAVARRAERRLWTLHRADPLPAEALRFVNRLSDLLFALAREEMARSGEAEDLWKAFTYKRSAR
jgi:ATP:cob(I)alamin adenosyltransferase